MQEQEELFYQEENKFHFLSNFVVPTYMREPILLYIKEGIHPGSFLASIIANNLVGAVGNADDNNIKEIPAFVNYFHNYAPNDCWGSVDLMNNWIESKRKERSEKSGKTTS